MGNTPPSAVDREWRAAIRFPLALPLRYSVLHRGMGRTETGSGQTIDVSSAGLRFMTDRLLPPGLYVELFMDWPVLLDGRVEVQLVMSGNVVRSNGTETAVQIYRHNFTTRGTRLTLA